nr:MAG TPA: hypothetical protein [Caudoviricetes sp.]
MYYFIIFVVSLMFWICFNILYLMFYYKLIQDESNLSDKFKRRLLLLGLVVPGLNIVIVMLYPLPIIFSIIKDTIKEEFNNEKD